MNTSSKQKFEDGDEEMAVAKKKKKCVKEAKTESGEKGAITEINSKLRSFCEWCILVVFKR